MEKFFSKHYKFKLTLFSNYYILKYHTKLKSVNFLMNEARFCQDILKLFNACPSLY